MIMFVKLLMSVVVGVQARLRDCCLFAFYLDSYWRFPERLLVLE